MAKSLRPIRCRDLDSSNKGEPYHTTAALPTNQPKNNVVSYEWIYNDWLIRRTNPVTVERKSKKTMSIAIPNKLTFLIFDLKKIKFALLSSGKSPLNPSIIRERSRRLYTKTWSFFCSTRMDFLILFLHATTNRRRVVLPSAHCL